MTASEFKRKKGKPWRASKELKFKRGDIEKLINIEYS